MSPNPAPEFCAVDDNVRMLRQAYCDELLAHQPRSVLDVGCGTGQVIEMLMANGVICTGLETGVLAQELCAILASGNSNDDSVRGVQAAAQSLPFADQSFDWVSMRHVPHHLANPEQAFAEAMRVSRYGLFLAEPYFDRSQADQALAEDVDLWLKAQHRRGGIVHHPNFDLDDVNRMLAHVGAVVQTSRIIPPLGPRRGDELMEAVGNYQQLLSPQDSDFEAGQVLIERLGHRSVTWNGSWCMSIRKP